VSSISKRLREKKGKEETASPAECRNEGRGTETALGNKIQLEKKNVREEVGATSTSSRKKVGRGNSRTHRD